MNGNRSRVLGDGVLVMHILWMLGCWVETKFASHRLSPSVWPGPSVPQRGLWWAQVH